MISYTNQIQILHFSDLHFGEHHICNPPNSASKNGMPTMGSLISKDLVNDFDGSTPDYTDYSVHTDSPLLIAVSGDFTQKALHKEFQEASEFLDTLATKKLLNRKIDKMNFFMVPGNHDVKFSESTSDERFQSYCSFYNRFYEGIRPPQLAHKPENLTQIHLREIDGNKILIAEVNCCIYVEKDTVDSSRGQVDFNTIGKLRTELEKITLETPDINDYIKLVIIHHHIVLLPSYIEPGRGVDSIMNAGYLLELLSEFNFHLILHGHKHYPQIFTYEPMPLWSEGSTKIPQVVIAGGSCGSKELPANISNKACNTYGLITIKWHPEAKQARIKVLTRGLIRTSATPLSPDRWKWETVNISDRVISPYNSIPKVGSLSSTILEDDTKRNLQYKLQRYAMPVAEVMPSLIAGQAYEVRAWIIQHRPDLNDLPDLVKVEWSAGERFKKIICLKIDNPKFSISYHYWGPMLIQAKLFFSDGYEAEAYVYARMPKDESE
jgi:predicted phosphodiesterase